MKTGFGDCGRWLGGRSKGGEGGDLGDRPIGGTSGRHKAKLPPTKPAKTISHIIGRVFSALGP